METVSQVLEFNEVLSQLNIEKHANVTVTGHSLRFTFAFNSVETVSFKDIYRFSEKLEEHGFVIVVTNLASCYMAKAIPVKNRTGATEAKGMLLTASYINTGPVFKIVETECNIRLIEFSGHTRKFILDELLEKHLRHYGANLDTGVLQRLKPKKAIALKYYKVKDQEGNMSDLKLIDKKNLDLDLTDARVKGLRFSNAAVIIDIEKGIRVNLDNHTDTPSEHSLKGSEDLRMKVQSFDEKDEISRHIQRADLEANLNNGPVGIKLDIAANGVGVEKSLVFTNGKEINVSAMETSEIFSILNEHRFMTLLGSYCGEYAYSFIQNATDKQACLYSALLLGRLLRAIHENGVFKVHKSNDGVFVECGNTVFPLNGESKGILRKCGADLTLLLEPQTVEIDEAFLMTSIVFCKEVHGHGLQQHCLKVVDIREESVIKGIFDDHDFIRSASFPMIGVRKFIFILNQLQLNEKHWTEIDSFEPVPHKAVDRDSHYNGYEGKLCFDDLIKRLIGNDIEKEEKPTFDVKELTAKGATEFTKNLKSLLVLILSSTEFAAMTANLVHNNNITGIGLDFDWGLDLPSHPDSKNLLVIANIYLCKTFGCIGLEESNPLYETLVDNVLLGNKL